MRPRNALVSGREMNLDIMTYPRDGRFFYPDWESYNETTGLMIIETDIGTFNITSISHGNWYDKFCNETGYTYISKNIGIGPYLTELGKQEALFNNIWLIVYIIVIIVIIALVIIFMFFRNRKKRK